MTNDELTEYIRMFHGTLYRIAFSYVRNCENAEDVCRNVFIIGTTTVSVNQ